VTVFGMSSISDPRVQLVKDLFAAWSSGDADAPESLMHPHAVLNDIVGGSHSGWPAIRAFFKKGLDKWPDLVLLPDQFWTSDDGVAVTWVMSATISEEMGAVFGKQHVGKKWSSPGMSWLRIVDGRVEHEVDYHDSGAVPKSLNAQ
jgi:ketosteroid isomerase-like protein